MIGDRNGYTRAGVLRGLDSITALRNKIRDRIIAAEPPPSLRGEATTPAVRAARLAFADAFDRELRTLIAAAPDDRIGSQIHFAMEIAVQALAFTMAATRSDNFEPDFNPQAEFFLAELMQGYISAVGRMPLEDREAGHA
jgi:hypothetical protein